VTPKYSVPLKQQEKPGDDMVLGGAGNDVLCGDEVDLGTHGLAGALNGKDYLWQSMPKTRIEWRSPAYA